jgi:signal transduction histidine kinase
MKAFAHNLQAEIDQFGALTDRTLACLRFILAIGALLIIYADPSEPDRYVAVTYETLIGYSIYSLVIYLIARRHINFSQRTLRILVWSDIAIYTVLIALSTGTNSLFSFFYLFAIIVAASRGGMNFGLTTTVASTLLFFAVDLVSAMQEPYELNRFLVRRLAMTALGFILSFWGGAELSLKRRLALLKDLSLVANPRFGADRTIEQMLRRLVNLYDADYGLLALNSDSGCTLYRMTADTIEGSCTPEFLEHDAVISPINSSDPFATVYAERRSFWRKEAMYRGYTGERSASVDLPVEEGRTVADLLEARTFVSVPVRFHDQLRGRLVIASFKRRNFELHDASFLIQVISQVFPVIENIRLVNRLAADASEEERRKIARSLHDRVIQPYYGLLVGLQGLHDLILPDVVSTNGKNKQILLLDQLMRMTSDGIDELRRYIQGLKHSDATEARLLESIRSFAEKFEVATGIRVKVADASGHFAINETLSVEVFQMTTEALSNVHRHTRSRSAEVSVKVENSTLVLAVENDAGDVANPSFNPASISERAEALGGRSNVFSNDGRTVVSVEVPL